MSVQAQAGQLQDMIEQSQRIVFFGGAGVSTESGIPDFRSANGLYCRQAVIPPETVLSHTFFLEHPDQFFDFYRKNMIFPHAQPNAAHQTLAVLERIGKLKAVITQNI
ncbi:MAG: Sir2 family NAD-dependent protein deacetylase, partial [Oscillospiraceae bacterium]